MQTEITFDLFDNRGKFRRDISEADRAGLAPDKLTLLRAVEYSADVLRDAESQIKTGEDSRKIAFDDLEMAKSHLATLRPTSVAGLENSERRRQMLPVAERVRLARLPVPPEIQQALAAVVEKEDIFEGSRTECRRLQMALSDARASVSTAIIKWQESFAAPTPAQLLRDYVKAEHRRRAAGNELAPVEERNFQSPLDAYMAGSKGPLGVRSSRQQQRNPGGPNAGGVYPASMRGQRVAVPTVKPWATMAKGPRS